MQPGAERDFVARVFVLTSTGKTGSSSSPELYLGKLDPYWVCMLQFIGTCLIGNAWCRISKGGLFGSGLTSSLSKWNYFSSLQKAHGLTQQSMVCHPGMMCPALANEAWDEVNNPSSLKTKACDLGSSLRTAIFLFVFWYTYSISPLKLVDSFWIIFSSLDLSYKQSEKFQKRGCRNLALKSPEIHN